jgi:hypothetical protein
MDDEILHYRSALAYNREVFLIEHGELVKVFSAIDGNFGPLIEPPRTMRDGNGQSHVALIPFISLLQRQGRGAFEAFGSYQSYQGWVLIRPGIEALLIIGKWTDDSANATIWKNRQQNRKEYQKAYQGQSLRSLSLPGSDKIQGVLSKINDDFVHANPDYYSRHLDIAQGDPGFVNFRLEYFDQDGLQAAHLFAFLNLLLVMQEALANLFAGLFRIPVELKASLNTFQTQFGARMAGLASRSADADAILKQLGLVTFEASRKC